MKRKKLSKRTEILMFFIFFGIIMAAAWTFAVTDDGPVCSATGADRAIHEDC